MVVCLCMCAAVTSCDPQDQYHDITRGTFNCHHGMEPDPSSPVRASVRPSVRLQTDEFVALCPQRLFRLFAFGGWNYSTAWYQEITWAGQWYRGFLYVLWICLISLRFLFGFTTRVPFVSAGRFLEMQIFRFVGPCGRRKIKTSHVF